VVKEEFGVVFEDELIDIVKECSAKKMWRGTLEERKAKFMEMHELLMRFYNSDVRLEFHGITEESDKKPGSSGLSYYNFLERKIVIKGRLSVITYLHELAHSLGCDQERAHNYAMGLFKICFPRSYESLAAVPDGSGLMIRQSEINDIDPVRDDDVPPGF